MNPAELVEDLQAALSQMNGNLQEIAGSNKRIEAKLEKLIDLLASIADNATTK